MFQSIIIRYCGGCLHKEPVGVVVFSAWFAPPPPLHHRLSLPHLSFCAPILRIELSKRTTLCYFSVGSAVKPELTTRPACVSFQRLIFYNRPATLHPTLVHGAGTNSRSSPLTLDLQIGSRWGRLPQCAARHYRRLEHVACGNLRNLPDRWPKGELMRRAREKPTLTVKSRLSRLHLEGDVNRGEECQDEGSQLDKTRLLIRSILKPHGTKRI